ncbi:hypothetical protein Q9Q95_11460 [Sphingomonas sp. DG1-23]|uniref:hypothetical protein n=1 Tax=Sphingomonas sp. DG1-23 TaxID=3068316 RepID=UPI00273E18A8|nr:hypothetical protein [Sphingomonas sp. DG1-23]MDP5279541.1 hypothetical protein [Sphingomonas sp. DG1-23]
MHALSGRFRPAAARNPNYQLLQRSQQQSAMSFVARQSRQGRGSIMIGAGGVYRQVAGRAGAGYYFSARGDFARAGRNVRRDGFGRPTAARSLPAGWRSNQKYIVRALLRGSAVGIGTPVQHRAPRGGFNAEMKLLRRLHARGLVNFHTQRVPISGGKSRLMLVGFTPTGKMLSLRPKGNTTGAPAPAPAPGKVR